MIFLFFLKVGLPDDDDNDCQMNHLLSDVDDDDDQRLWSIRHLELWCVSNFFFVFPSTKKTELFMNDDDDDDLWMRNIYREREKSESFKLFILLQCGCVCLYFK